MNNIKKTLFSIESSTIFNPYCIETPHNHLKQGALFWPKRGSKCVFSAHIAEKGLRTIQNIILAGRHQFV